MGWSACNRKGMPQSNKGTKPKGKAKRKPTIWIGVILGAIVPTWVVWFSVEDYHGTTNPMKKLVGSSCT